MYIMAPLSARRAWPGSRDTVTIWDSFPSILEATSKLIGVATTPSEEVVWTAGIDDDEVDGRFEEYREPTAGCVIIVRREVGLFMFRRVKLLVYLANGLIE
jgi:hypothetical protein